MKFVAGENGEIPRKTYPCLTGSEQCWNLKDDGQDITSTSDFFFYFVILIIFSLLCESQIYYLTEIEFIDYTIVHYAG